MRFWDMLSQAASILGVSVINDAGPVFASCTTEGEVMLTLNWAMKVGIVVDQSMLIYKVFNLAVKVFILIDFVNDFFPNFQSVYLFLQGSFFEPPQT